MGNRLSKLVTKTGDDGTTGIGGNHRLDKDSPRIEVIGTIDELNASIGMVVSQSAEIKIVDVLNEIQHRLFDLGGELAMPGHSILQQKDVQQLEQWLQDFNQFLPPLKEFVLPKGDGATTCCHLARTICRRAERRMVTFQRIDAQQPDAVNHSKKTINSTGCIYLNRLSDLLFVFCRLLARVSDSDEEMWQSCRIKPDEL